MSGTFTWLISKWFNFKYSAYPIFLGIAYGLSGYSVIYAGNVMWLDGLVLLPLISYALIRGLKTNTWLAYSVLLACTIIFNYYIGYMICIFLVILFLAYTVNNFEDRKNFWCQFAGFAISSISSGLISAVVILPTVFNLSSNKLAQADFNSNFSVSPFNAIGKTVSALFIGDSYNNWAPIFVGTLAAIVFIIYFLDSKNTIKERVTNLVIGLFFVLSIAVTKLYLFWHGGQQTVAYPCRFGFLIVFWILLLAAKELSRLRETKKERLIATGLYLIVSFVAVYMRKRSGPWNAYIAIAILLVIVFGALIYFSDRRFVRMTLLLIGLVEISGNLYLGLEHLSIKSGIYPSYVSENQKIISKIPASDKNGRMAKNYELNNDRGEGYTFNYRGMEEFSSNNDSRISTLMTNLGFSTFRYFYYYQTGTVVTDAIFNVKTFINSSLPNQSIAPEYISYGLRDDLKNHPVIVKQNDKTAYRNETLPFAFAGSLSNKLKFKENPVYNQNLVLNSLTQTKENVLRFSPKRAKVDSQNLNVKFRKGKYRVNRNDTNKSGSITFTYNDLKPDQVGYIRFSKNLMKQIEVLNRYKINSRVDPNNLPVMVRINGKKVYLQEYTDQLIGVQADKNGKVEVKFILNGKADKVEFKYPRFVTINAKALSEKVKKADSRQMKFTTFRDGYIAGKVHIGKNENLVTTIPYSKGWHIEVDGKPVKANRTLKVFVGLKLKPGTHKVTLKYKTPGLLLGILVSIVGVIVLIGYTWYLKKNH